MPRRDEIENKFRPAFRKLIQQPIGHSELLMDGFEEACCALASADAHRYNSVTGARAAGHFVTQRSDHAGSSHTEGMAD
jgi:hypothetical protein